MPASVPASVPVGAGGSGAGEGEGAAAAAAAPAAAAASGGPIKRKASAMSGDTAKEGEIAEAIAPEVRKKRFAWTDELHRIFIASIFDVGLRQAKPKIILQNMGDCPEELTTEHIKSHLQKYRANSQRTKDLFLKQFEIARKEAAANSDGKAINPGFHAYPMPAGPRHVLHPELVAPLLEVGRGEGGNILSSVRPHTFFPSSREAQLYSLGQPAPPGLALQGLPHVAHAAPPPLQQQQQQQQQPGRFIHDCHECAAAAAREAGHDADGLGAGGRSLLRGGAPHHHHYAHTHHHSHELAAGNGEAERNGGRAPQFAAVQAPQLFSQMELQMRIHKEFEEKHDSRLGSRTATQLPRPPTLPSALRAASHLHHQQQHTHHLHQHHLEEQAIAHAHAREGSSSSSSSAAAAAAFPADAPTPGQQQANFEQLETNFYESASQQNVHMSPLITSNAMTLIEQQPFPELEPLDDGELFGFLH